MSSDKFVNSSTNPFLSEQDDNFFMQPENIAQPSGGTVRHLNDYDSNILQKEAYRDVNNEVFKLEYKIAKTEEELKQLEGQIQTAKDIHDFELTEKLYSRYKQLKFELSELVELYNETSLSAKISGEITGIFPGLKSHFRSLKRLFEGFESMIISRLPKKLSSSIELKKSLEKLENINKSVDELMTLQTPYGEAGDKYVQLSKYITRANSIHAEISRSLK